MIDTSLNAQRPVVIGLVLTVIGVAFPFFFLYGLGYLSFLPLTVGLGFAVVGFRRSEKGSRWRAWAIISFVLTFCFVLFIVYVAMPVRVTVPLEPIE